MSAFCILAQKFMVVFGKKRSTTQLLLYDIYGIIILTFMSYHCRTNNLMHDFNIIWDNKIMHQKSRKQRIYAIICCFWKKVLKQMIITNHLTVNQGVASSSLAWGAKCWKSCKWRKCVVCGAFLFCLEVRFCGLNLI